MRCNNSDSIGSEEVFCSIDYLAPERGVFVAVGIKVDAVNSSLQVNRMLCDKIEINSLRSAQIYSDLDIDRLFTNYLVDDAAKSKVSFCVCVCGNGARRMTNSPINLQTSLRLKSRVNT